MTRTAARKASILAFSLLLLIASTPGTGADQAVEQAATPAAPAANPADVASVDSIIAAVYDVISGPAGKKRDWDRMRSLFAPGARLIPTFRQKDGSYNLSASTVEQYITRSAPYLEGEGFFEKEVARRAEQYGHIAQVFSTYEARRKADDKQPFMRGINSFQLMNDGKRWWVVTIFWEAEGPGVTIPDKYLK